MTLLGEIDSILEEEDRLTVVRRELDDWRRVDCCTGRRYPKGKVRCQRCGELVSDYDTIVDHDLGFNGCPAESDPLNVIIRTPEHGSRFARRITMHVFFEDIVDVEWAMNLRHDTLHMPLCVCGHAWGLHGDPLNGQPPAVHSCRFYCRCRGYVGATT